MAFEKLKENTNDLQENGKAYLESSIAYYKLWGFKVAMKSTTMIVKLFLISMFFMVFLLFVSIAAALALGEMMNSYPIGFLIIGAIYFVFALLSFLVKDKMVEGPILEKFSEIFFND